MNKLFPIIVLFFVLTSSCSVTKRLPSGSYLLSGNELSVSYPDTLGRRERISKDKIKEYIPVNQTPNTRVLGYNLSLRIYQAANPESDSWGNRVLRKLGKPPVLFDSLSNKSAANNLRLYMESEGFYGTQVLDSVIYKGKRAYAHYDIIAPAPCVIESYTYNFADSVVMPYVLKYSSESLIHKGMTLTRSLLTNERLRISETLQNEGFYYFSVGSVDYLIDTVGNKADVIININKQIVDRVHTPHKRYKVSSVSVSSKNNSLAYLASGGEAEISVLGDVTYYEPTSISTVRPEILEPMLSVEVGQVYSKSNANTTKSKLNTIPLYRNVSVAFAEDTLKVNNAHEGLLRCDISLEQELQQSFKADVDASTNNNYSGVSLTLGYSNKNMFGAGETFSAGVTGGYEFMHASSNKDSWELGGTVSLSIPRLVAPFEFARIRSLRNISTQMEVAINSQRRPYYDRTTTSIYYGYAWTSGAFSYNYRPANVSIISVPWTDEAYMSTIENPYLLESYKAQLIAGSTFSIMYTNGKKEFNRINVKTNVETSGNLMYLGSKLFAAKLYTDDVNEQYYKVFDTHYSQYLRGDLTFTYTTKVSDYLTLAYRLYGGGGYCYGNSVVLPIERQFYSGGGSSMRGWQIRTLGPGNTAEQTDALYPEQRGNIKLETNIEARFPIYDVMHGALFFDLGNIWSNVAGETNDEARFAFGTFYKQLALNTGLGIRLDFDFFVIRMDWGIQLYNPGWEAGSRWVRKFNFDNTALHFAIGYPF